MSKHQKYFLKKAYRRIAITDDSGLLASVADVVRKFEEGTSFHVEKLNIGKAKFSSCRPVEICSVTAEGTYFIDGKEYEASASETEIAIWKRRNGSK